MALVSRALSCTRRHEGEFGLKLNIKPPGAVMRLAGLTDRRKFARRARKRAFLESFVIY